MNTADESRIELADAVETIRDELLTTARRSAGQDVVFALGDTQMEFTVTLHAQDARTGAPLKVGNDTEGSVAAFGRATTAPR